MFRYEVSCAEALIVVVCEKVCASLRANVSITPQSYDLFKYYFRKTLVIWSLRENISNLLCFYIDSYDFSVFVSLIESKKLAVLIEPPTYIVFAL